MGGYTKLFNSILASSIWSENNITRIVWITLLAMTNQDGLAETSIPGLAAIARVSMEECKAAIEILSAPDEYSRTIAHDGRRIERVSGGYLVLNYDVYRCKMDEQEQADKAAVRQQRWRDRHPRNANVTPRNASNDIAKAEAKAEAKEQAEEAFVIPDAIPEVLFDCSKVALREPTDAELGMKKKSLPASPGARGRGDSRHSPIREVIFKLYYEKFSVKCSWDESEAAALKKILNANPSWTIQDVTHMVENRFMSQGVTGARPRAWLPRITDWAGGTLDRYGKSNIGSHNGQAGAQIHEQNVSELRAVAELRRARRMAAAKDGSATRDVRNDGPQDPDSN